MSFQQSSTTEKGVTDLLLNQSEQGVQALNFDKVSDYTTFVAEHAFDGDDIVFHFFRSAENGGNHYWKEVFPEALSEVAQAVFQAGYPRLKAAWTEEQDSWWMRANGFVSVGLPEERVKSFYEKLDQALEAAKISHKPS